MVKTRSDSRPQPSHQAFFSTYIHRQATMFIPVQSSHWGREFCIWISRRYKAERETWDTYFPALDTPEGQLERVADLAAIGESLDIDDPMVRPLWIEYLTECRERLDYWRRFQLQQKSPCHILPTKLFCS